MQTVHDILRRASTAVLAVCAASVSAGCGGDESSAGKMVIEYWHQPMISVVPGKEEFTSEPGDDCVLQFFWGMGADVYENHQYDHVALNSPAGVKALTWLIDAHQQGSFSRT